MSNYWGFPDDDKIWEDSGKPDSVDSWSNGDDAVLDTNMVSLTEGSITLAHSFRPAQSGGDKESK